MRDAESKLESGHRVHRQDDCRRGRIDRARPGRPQSSSRYGTSRDGRTGAGGIRVGGSGCRDGLRPARGLPRAVRVVRDLLVLGVDPSRISDPEIAGEGERERLTMLAGRFWPKISCARSMY